MQIIDTIKGGFGCAAGAAAGGWAAAILAPQDYDDEYVEKFGNFYFQTVEGKSAAEWAAKQAATKRLLLWVRWSSDRRQEQLTLSTAERIGGVAVAGGERAAAVWTDRTDAVWRLRLWADGEAAILAESDRPLTDPAAVWAAGRIAAACGSTADGRETVVYYDGERTLALEGRKPKLAALTDGGVLIVLERLRSPEQVDLVAYAIRDGRVVREIGLRPAGDHNFDCDLAVAPDGTVYALWVSCPAPGSDERSGLYRDLSLWTYRTGDAGFKPAPATSNGHVHLQAEAFLDGSMQNLVPMHPRVIVQDGSPVLAYKRYTLDGHKGYGWDTYLLTQDNGIWRAPARVAEKGHADTGYAILAREDGFVGFFPRCYSKPTRELGAKPKKFVFGEPLQGNYHAENHRIEITRFQSSEALPPMPVPDYMKAFFVIPPSVRNVAPEPPELAYSGGMKLVWGDLHAHSSYSKCQTANDGLPRDVLGFERDILGRRVLCLSEHVEYLSSQEFHHVLDHVEMAAGHDYIPLYAMEKNVQPSNHTIFYAIDREVLDRFRGIVLREYWREPLYARIKRELPAGSILALRHMHGVDDNEFGVATGRNVETFDPEIEYAMEALQGRQNMMLSQYRYKSRHLPLFPSNFLNGGAKIGLVGGTDHVRGRGSNKFGLTGFWVPEVMPQAVFDAIKNRKTLASANGKLAIYAELDGCPIGDATVAGPPVRIKAFLGSARTIRRACLIRDGEVLEWIDIGSSGSVEIELRDERVAPGRHWYAVTAEADSYYDGYPVIAHASPIFVEIQ